MTFVYPDFLNVRGPVGWFENEGGVLLLGKFLIFFLQKLARSFCLVIFHIFMHGKQGFILYLFYFIFFLGGGAVG